MRVYVINLDRQPERMERMSRLMGGLEFERVPAVDGKDLPGPERRLKDVPTRPEEVTRFERAVALSHREAWRRVVCSGAALACILEDDVVLSSAFARFVSDGSWVPADADLVKIEAFSKRRLLMGPHEQLCEGRSLCRLLSNNLGTAGYVMSAKGAEKLLSRTEILSRPLDHILFEDLLQEDGYQIYQLYPALCVQESRVGNPLGLSQFTSSVQGSGQSRLTLKEKMTREVKRPFLTSRRVLKSYFNHKIHALKFERVEFL